MYRIGEGSYKEEATGKTSHEMKGSVKKYVIALGKGSDWKERASNRDSCRGGYLMGWS